MVSHLDQGISLRFVLLVYMFLRKINPKLLNQVIEVGKPNAPHLCPSLSISLVSWNGNVRLLVTNSRQVEVGKENPTLLCPTQGSE